MICHCLLSLPTLMSTIHPGSAHFFGVVVLNAPRTVPDKDCKIYDCFIPCAWTGNNGCFVNCSLCHLDFTTTLAVQPEIFNVHAKVRMEGCQFH